MAKRARHGLDSECPGRYFRIIPWDCVPELRKVHIHSTTFPLGTLKLPPGGCHPVIIARKLLLLATFLQGISPAVTSKLQAMTADHTSIMTRLVRTVNSLVTNNDELLQSLDGIECVMIESMYWNNNGNLRRSWLTTRRAITLAQLMGLNTDSRDPPQVLQEETKNRIDPAYMWFRLVSTDRYLCLMLGLPQATSQHVFEASKGLGDSSPIERMARLDSVVAGLLLQYNKAERTDMAKTSRLDSMLWGSSGVYAAKLVADDLQHTRSGSRQCQNARRIYKDRPYICSPSPCRTTSPTLPNAVRFIWRQLRLQQDCCYPK